MEVGCDGYLAKPCEPRAVVAEVQRFLGRTRAECRLRRRLARTPEGRRAPRPARILVVDDHEDNIELLRARLESVGLRDRRGDGRRGGARDTSRATPPDLILLDVMMPEIDGIEVARRIKANKSLPFIPIIMQTALDSTEAQGGGARGGRRRLHHEADRLRRAEGAAAARCCASSACRRRSRSASASCSR